MKIPVSFLALDRADGEGFEESDAEANSETTYENSAYPCDVKSDAFNSEGQFDPDLEQINAAWPSLSAESRRRVMDALNAEVAHGASRTPPRASEPKGGA